MHDEFEDIFRNIFKDTFLKSISKLTKVNKESIGFFTNQQQQIKATSRFFEKISQKIENWGVQIDSLYQEFLNNSTKEACFLSPADLEEVEASIIG